MDVAEDRNSRKRPFSDDQVLELLGSIETVFVAQGKKIREIASVEAELADLKGPTGKYRAPMVRVGDRLLVGFHAETLGSWLSA